jgi:hypothetical protein
LREGRVDQLDVDPAVLHGLGSVGDLKQLAGGLFGMGVGPVRGEFHRVSSRSVAALSLARGKSQYAETAMKYVAACG